LTTKAGMITTYYPEILISLGWSKFGYRRWSNFGCFFQALGDPDIQVKAIARGAAGYLPKPFNDKVLLDRVAYTISIKSKGPPDRERGM